MKRLPVRAAALLMTIAAVAAAGCGSSSSSKKQPAASPTPTGVSTPATSSTPAPAGISSSTAISSPAYRALLIRGEQQATQGRFTQAQLSSLADCAIKKLQAQGVQTVGQALAKQSEFRNLGGQCAQELGIHPK